MALGIVRRLLAKKYAFTDATELAALALAFEWDQDWSNVWLEDAFEELADDALEERWRILEAFDYNLYPVWTRYVLGPELDVAWEWQKLLLLKQSTPP